MPLRPVLFALVWAAAPSVSSLAAETVPFDFPPARQVQSAAPARCAFADLALPDDFSVFAAGAYSGRAAGYQIDQSGHEATRIDVAVNSRQKPVVLLLGAYEPTVWNIGWSAGTRIVAVLVSGYHRQAIAGLPAHTPVLNSSYDNRGPCGYFYVSNDQLPALNPVSRRLFGRAVDMAYVAKEGYVLVGNDLAPGTALQTSPDTKPDAFRDAKAPLAGQAGLDDAVRRGILRQANSADAAAWTEALQQGLPPRDVPPVAGQALARPRTPRLHNAFVVLKPFTYPAGLYGGNSATFYIPKGVPKPQGQAGHSTVFDFNSLTECMSLSCK